MSISETADDNLVAAKDTCPACGEHEMDLLVWFDDDCVRCMNCGTEYAPGLTEKAE